jgi:hypothetical protein
VALLVAIAFFYYQYGRRQESAGKKTGTTTLSEPAQLPKKNAPPPKATSQPQKSSTEPKPLSPPSASSKGKTAADREKTGARLCFLEGKWSEGLPSLADSDQEKIKRLAQKELASPQTVAEKLALADGWWALGEKYAPPAREHIRRHAVEWYKKIVNDLEDSEKDRAEWRIDLGEPLKPGEKAPINPNELQ